MRALWLGVLAGCQGAINLVEGGDPLVETRLTGVVADPQFGADGEFDLSTQPVVGAVTCDGDEVELELSRPDPAFGGNDAVFRFTLDADGRPVSARAELVQWADFNAYGGDFSRRLPATSGLVTLAAAEDLCGAVPVLAGTFSFDTRAGSVAGSFAVPALR